jgi:hypothetical protein
MHSHHTTGLIYEIIQTVRPLTTRIFTPIGLWTKATYNKK